MFEFDEVNTETRLYLTSSDKSNFRYDRATIQPYKGNRVGTEKPFHLPYCKQYLQDAHDAIVVYDMEADDQLAIDASVSKGNLLLVDADIVANITAFKAVSMAKELGVPVEYIDLRLLDKDMDKTLDHIATNCNGNETYIATADKDLDMTYAMVYNIRTRKISTPGDYVRLSENRKKVYGRGIAWFYAQMLLGDACDHIPKVARGYGPVTVSEILSICECEKDYFNTVWTVYKFEHGESAKERFMEVAALLWMCTVQIPDIEVFLKDKYKDEFE